jgi:ribosome-associated translation inhibitor RaiA
MMMALQTRIDARGVQLGETDRRRVQHHLDTLARRLVHRSEPIAVLALDQQRQQRRIRVDLRVELGPDGPTLVSHQAAETVDRAAELAVTDVERQLERLQAGQRGEASFGVPSRREPERLRPGRAGQSQPGEAGS